jgi:hypothetical protein
MKHPKTKLPACGTFLGTPVYLHRGDTVFQTSGLFYTSWVSEDHDAAWYINQTIQDNQGNLVAIWDGGATKQSLLAMADYMALDELGLAIPQPDWKNGTNLTPGDWDEIGRHPERLGAGLVRMLKQAEENDLALMTIYTEADPRQLKRMKPYLNRFLGCNVGEVFTFRLNSEEDPVLALAKQATTGDLRQLANNFIQSVQRCVRKHKADGWSQMMVTGGIATLDYEIIGGIEIPAVEDFAVPHINIASAISRGLYRQFDLPIWGTDIAHEHYSFLPYASLLKMPLLTASLYLKYMSGCKLLLVESGNWWQQSDHVEDTPMHQVPKLALGPIHTNDPHLTAPYVDEARKHYLNINYNSPVCREYRRRISDFYDFLKASGTPAGQPATRIAAIKGNLDLAGPGYHPNAVIAGQYDLADKDARWFQSMPERSWDIFARTFYPRPPVLGEYPNPFLSGTPYGITDIVSFAADPDADFLAGQYAALLFAGWNTCTAKQYEALVAYVRQGGTLFISIPHLSTNTTRNFTSYGTDELIHGGDFSELCGVKVTGRGKQFYWAITPGNDRPLGVSPFRKFGICMTHRGDIELGPATEVIAVEDEQFTPLLIRHKLGKGTVYFLNVWEYPGALDSDVGPSATRDSVGFIGAIYRKIALETRGDTYITDDGQLPGTECQHVVYTCFPENGEICLYNIDFENPHTLHLHHGGRDDVITLAPAEFRTIR